MKTLFPNFRNEGDLLGLIKNRAQESLHLEFKQSDALEKSDRGRQKLAKEVAAMATAALPVSERPV